MLDIYLTIWRRRLLGIVMYPFVFVRHYLWWRNGYSATRHEAASVAYLIWRSWYAWQPMRGLIEDCKGGAYGCRPRKDSPHD